MISLKRLDPQNPLIVPRNLWWERKGVFNAGTVLFNKEVLLLYRAYGEDNVSRFGVAVSKDGRKFSYWGESPVFSPDPNSHYETHGVEDPRITQIDSKYAIVYTAAGLDTNSMHPQVHGWKTRISLAWTEDFQNFHRHGVLIHSYDDKDAAFFPKKWDGWYYLYHRRHPNIWLSKSQDLNTWVDVCEENCIVVMAALDRWDGERIGIGSPPIYTDLGWLVFYHGRDIQGVYRLGAFVADYERPDKIRFKLPYPILEPELPFEKEGMVPNVVFTCGAVDVGDEYIVYYGGADYAIGGAKIGKKELLEELKKYPVF